MRRLGADDEQLEAQVFAVLDRVGRLQLPADYVAALELSDRVRLALEPDHLGVWRTTGPASGEQPSVELPVGEQPNGERR